MGKTEEQKRFASYVMSLEPYDVIVKNDRICDGICCRPNCTQLEKYLESYLIDDTKVYLRPMSDMTDNEIKKLISFESGMVYEKDLLDNTITPIEYKTEAIDYLNSRLIDYRNYISLGRAIAVTKERYKLDD